MRDHYDKEWAKWQEVFAAANRLAAEGTSDGRAVLEYLAAHYPRRWDTRTGRERLTEAFAAMRPELLTTLREGLSKGAVDAGEEVI
jgi:hypothetical protein